jgi:uncharacterized membrane protein
MLKTFLVIIIGLPLLAIVVKIAVWSALTTIYRFNIRRNGECQNQQKNKDVRG